MTSQLHLLPDLPDDGAADDSDVTSRESESSRRSVPVAHRLDAATIARGRQGVAEARAVLEARRGQDGHRAPAA